MTDKKDEYDSFNAKRNVAGMMTFLESEAISKDHRKEQLFIKGNVKDELDEQFEEIDARFQELSQELSQSDSDEDSRNSDTETKEDPSQFTQKSEYQKLKQRLSQDEEESQILIRQRNDPLRNDSSAVDKQSLNSTLTMTSEEAKDPLLGHLKRLELVDDIEDMLSLLREERIDTSNFPNINASMTIDELQMIKHILKRKLRKLQSTSLVDDSLFMVLKGVEGVFNGKTSVFGCSPNLKGLGKSVSLKMRHQKQDLSDEMEEFCSKHSIGSNSQMVAQILISAVKRHTLNKDISREDDFSDDLSTLQELYNQE